MLEPSCCKKQPKSPNQETCLGNWGCLKVLNIIKLYHSEPSDVPYSPNQFLGWDFFATSYSKMALAFHDNLFDMLNYFIANKYSL